MQKFFTLFCELMKKYVLNTISLLNFYLQTVKNSWWKKMPKAQYYETVQNIHLHTLIYIYINIQIKKYIT